jgi:hypothetical protein
LGWNDPAPTSAPSTNLVLGLFGWDETQLNLRGWGSRFTNFFYLKRLDLLRSIFLIYLLLRRAFLFLPSFSSSWFSFLFSLGPFSLFLPLVFLHVFLFPFNSLFCGPLFQCSVISLFFWQHVEFVQKLRRCPHCNMGLPRDIFLARKHKFWLCTYWHTGIEL